jgi:hypothetical protein
MAAMAVLCLYNPGWAGAASLGVVQVTLAISHWRPQAAEVGVGTSTPTAAFEVGIGHSTLADSWITRSSRRFEKQFVNFSHQRI